VRRAYEINARQARAANFPAPSWLGRGFCFGFWAWLPPRRCRANDLKQARKEREGIGTRSVHACRIPLGSASSYGLHSRYRLAGLASLSGPDWAARAEREEALRRGDRAPRPGSRLQTVEAPPLVVIAENKGSGPPAL
jgi:hypothetical protein